MNDPGTMHPGILLSALRDAGLTSRAGKRILMGAAHRRAATLSERRFVEAALDELRGDGPLLTAARLADALGRIGLSRRHAAALLAGGRSLLNFVSSGGACAATGAASGAGDGAAPDGACRATGTP